MYLSISSNEYVIYHDLPTTLYNIRGIVGDCMGHWTHWLVAGDELVLQLLAPEVATSKAFYPEGPEGERTIPKRPGQIGLVPGSEFAGTLNNWNGFE